MEKLIHIYLVEYKMSKKSSSDWKSVILKEIGFKADKIKGKKHQNQVYQLPKQSITISSDSDLNLIKIKLSNRKAY